MADEVGAAKTSADNPAVFERSLRRTVDALLHAGKRVLIIKSVPEFHRRVFDSVAKEIIYGGDTVDYPQISLSSYNERNQEVLAAFSRLRGVEFIDPTDLFCSGIVCSSVDARKRILFSDTNHVNEYGAELIARELMTHLTVTLRDDRLQAAESLHRHPAD
jgi:hypothetical protein